MTLGCYRVGTCAWAAHTSTLPRLVFQGPDFEASFQIWAGLDFSPISRFMTEAMTMSY